MITITPFEYFIFFMFLPFTVGFMARIIWNHYKGEK